MNKNASHGILHSLCFKPISVGLIIALVCNGPVAQAQMQADPNAAGNKRPVIDNTANGLPLVQIATPNAAGLSHNQYRQFNVGKSGAILNNASGNTRTELSGWVGGNPNLPNGGARVILNEVTSAHPSALRGYLEVAGRRAEVIVSNPNGILVEGAGFINASRGILTTGSPVLGPGGALDGFRVTRGAVTIGAGGFNDSQTSQIDLIARSVDVNGKLHADRLNVVAGANQVNYADLGVQIIQGADDKPTVAIDIAELGGMYANSIRLIGTEAGVGVRSYGKMASDGNFSIDSKGRITLTGHASSTGDLTVTARDGIHNSGTVYAQRNTTIASQGDIANSGTIAALGDTSLTGRKIDSTGSLGAGIDGAGRLNGKGSLSVIAAQTLTATGQHLSTQELDFSGTALDLSGAMTQAGGNASLTASAGDIRNKNGKLTAAGSMTVRTGGAVDNTGATTASGGVLTITAASLDNSRGSIGTGNTVDGDIRIDSSGKLTNTAGQIVSARNLAATAQTLVGDGQVKAMQDTVISLQGDYTQTAGNQLSANRDFTFTTTGTLTNDGTLSGGRNTHVQAGNVNNRSTGLMNSNGVTLLTIDNALTNTGKIYGDDIAIGASGLDNLNGAVIAARTTVNIGAARIFNSEHALLKSDSDMAIGGALDANNKATGSAGNVTNSSATIDSGGQLAIDSAVLLNTNAHFSSEIRPDPGKSRNWTEYLVDGNPRVYSSDEAFVDGNDPDQKIIIRSTGGRFEDYTIRSIRETTSKTMVLTSEPGQILARGDMTLTGGQVVNDKSDIVAAGKLNAKVDGIDNGGTNPQGEIIVHREVTSTHHTVESCGFAGSEHCNKTSVDIQDLTLPTTHFDLDIWKARQHAQPDSNGNPAQGQNVAITGRPGGVSPLSYVPGSLTPHFGMPDNLLFSPARAGLGYLIESDPAFINYRSFLSSDYQLSRMGMDPQTAQKRLGDGYYEQKLVNDQILQLTGSKTLGAYAGNEDQYRALLESGVAYARQFNLLPGIALSAAQMAALTSDLVWLVEQSVTLADGSVHKVLAPVVYLSRLHAQDLKPTGALIAAESIDLQLNGSLVNAGTLKAGSTLIVNAAQDINNMFGAISSDSQNGTTVLQAGGDLNNRSGGINGNRVGILAGRDLNSSTIANTATGPAGTQISLDKTASIHAGTLTAQARRDINLSAAEITASGDAAFVAGRNLNVTAVATQDELKVAYDDKNHLYKRQEQVNGTTITTGGNATFTAGNDISTQAAYVNAGKALTADAGSNIDIGAATQSSSYDQEIYTASSGILSSKRMHSKDKQNSTQAIGSTLSGNSVTARAGNNLHVTGSNVVSTSGTQLAAVGNVAILTSQDNATQTYSKQEKTSGVFSGGGIGVTVGRRSLENDQTSKQLINNASAIGSTNGSVSIAAGQSYTQTGSNVLTPEGDIDIAARRVDINAATDTDDVTQDTRFRQSGLTVQLTSPVLSAIQTARQMKQAAGQTKDARLQVLAGTTAGLAAVNAADAVTQNPATAGGVNVSMSLGASKSNSHSEQHASTARGSTVDAGGSVRLAATGDGDKSDLTIAGSRVTANDNITLNAEHNLNLIAAASTAAQHSNNSGSSASIGIGFTAGGASNGVTLNAGVSGNRGNADGNDIGYTNTRITAGNQLATTSGNDTSLKGAVVAGKQVTTTVEGDLNIESLQDTSIYNSKQQSAGAGVSLCLPPFCYGASGASGNIGQSKINSNYASVKEQSGIKAGDGGFDIQVKGNTDLKGGQIASTGQAIKDGRNSLTTATLTQSDVRNHADYKGQSIGIGGGVNFGGGNNGNVGTDQQGKARSGPDQVPGKTLPADKNGLAIAPPVVMSATGNAASTTRSGISGGALNIINDLAQQQKTGQSAQQAMAAVNREVASDKDGANRIWPIFNEKEIQAGFAITQALTSEIGTYLNNRAREADAQKKAASDPGNALTAEQRAQLLRQASETESNWGPGGTYRQIATALTAAASGNVTGGAGQFAQAATVNYLQSLAAEQVKHIADGMGSETARAALHAVVGCAGAAGQGANCGAGAMGASASSVIGSLLGPASHLSNEEKEARKNAVASLIAGIAATGNHAATATAAGQIEAENNTLYVWRNNVKRTDKIPNDKVVVLGRQDAWRVLKQPVKHTGYPQTISAIGLDQLKDSQVYDLTLTKDFETLRKGTDMGYYTTSDNTQVYFQNGMDNHAPDAKASSALLAGLLNQPVGAIINDSHGIGGDVKEYLPDTFTTKDILNEYTYRKLDAQGKPVLIVMHSAGNEDAHKALEAGRVYGNQYPNLSFLSVGSPVSAGKLQSVMQQTGATYLGQVNNWRDPVTYSKTAVGVVGGTLVTGAALGAWYGGSAGATAGAAAGAPAGPLGSFFLGAAGAGLGASLGAGLGASLGAGLGVAGFMGLKNYHPFAQYFQNQQLQQQVLDWQKQQEPATLKK